MAIDLIRGGRIASRGIRKTKSTNSYIKTLIKVFYSFIFSFIHSYREELNLNSIQLCTKDLTKQDLIDILFLFQGLLKPYQTIIHLLLQDKPNLIVELLLLLELLPMIQDFFNFLKDSEYVHLNSQLKQEIEY